MLNKISMAVESAPTGNFEFALTHGFKRVCIVEAREEKKKKIQAQNLVECKVCTYIYVQSPTCLQLISIITGTKM